MAKPIHSLIAQTGTAQQVTQQITQMTGLPVVDSWQGVLFLLIAIWAFLVRRKGESLIVMDEELHKKKLEHDTKSHMTQAEQLTDARRQLKELQDKLDAKSDTQLGAATKEADDLRKKLHDSRNETMKTLERCLQAEADLKSKSEEHKARVEFIERYHASVVAHKDAEIARLRRGREFYRKKCEDAAQDMHLRGLEEESAQLAAEISSPNDVSSPGVLLLPPKKDDR